VSARVKRFLQTTVLLFLVAFSVAAIATPISAHALQLQPGESQAQATQDCNSKGAFLGINPWYYGLSKYDNNSNSCVIISPSAGKDNLQNFIWHIVLNILGIMIRIVGYIAVVMIIYGGFMFLTGGDNPSQVQGARTTILNAIIGLVLSISATAIINLIVSKLMGGASIDPTTGLPSYTNAQTLWTAALNLVYYAAGAVAVIMLILAGFRYITANGDSNAITKAKNQILYSAIGIIIVFVAFTITHFVVFKIQG